jgi:molecular chaperone GrpE
VTTRRTGEPQDAAPPPRDMSESEDPAVPPEQRAGVGDLTDTSGVDNFIEEGAPLEPSDLDGPDAPAVAGDGAAAELAASELALAERTADLQRLQAEYLNYKRRVERDRELVRENATYAALAPIVDVLDTIDRARDSARSLGSELEAGFSAVAEQLERVVASAGLVKFGEPGDAFDPNLHEALSHMGEDPDVEVTTCKLIAKAGYRIGDRVVRAAQVVVVDPVGS